MNFTLKTEYKPAGDQEQAIKKLVKGIQNGSRCQVLRGVTGSGKTFTAANVIAKTNKPTLVISHNKTLAWQLYEELKDFFPQNAVHYFVSYYDYYQPEAYMPASDTYIEKDASINEKIDKMRHAAVQSLLTRPDTIVVASVSCIYNLGSPETYQKVSMDLTVGQKITRRELLNALVSLGYGRNDIDPHAGLFRAKGERVEIHPPTGDVPFVVTLGKDIINSIIVPPGGTIGGIIEGAIVPPGGTIMGGVRIFPANFWITPEDKLKIARANIEAELERRTVELKSQGKELEAYRLGKKTNYDLEMIRNIGYCSGIENYSRHLEFRDEGSPPFTLLNYMPKDFLTIIDESHMTIPQIRGMYAGDRARKQTLIDYGFRLPSAIDNRPLKFEEFNERVRQTICMSATPNEYELEKAHMNNDEFQNPNVKSISKSKCQKQSRGVIEQLVRPTGLLDPVIEVRGTKKQMENAVAEIKQETTAGNRTLVVTITKRLAEDIAEYLAEEGLRVNYIHSDIHTLDRPVIMNKLRRGDFDALVGINLLREGLDLPEVSLVIIFDADKEGFLRNETTLLQTMGRAARHERGRVVMYADKITGSMRAAMNETERRREIQRKFNEEHSIVPRGISKALRELPDELLAKEKEKEQGELARMSAHELEREMKRAAKTMDFERAARLRDELKKLQ